MEEGEILNADNGLVVEVNNSTIVEGDRVGESLKVDSA